MDALNGHGNVTISILIEGDIGTDTVAPIKGVFR